MLPSLFNSPSPLFSSRGIDLDFPLLAGCLALLGLGLVMIASSSSEIAAVNLGNTHYNTIRHLVYLCLGVIACGLTMMVPMTVVEKYSAHLLLLAVVLLALVLLPGIGREVNGAKRWIGVGLFNVQPSELAKVFAVTFLAGYLVRRQKEVRGSWMGFFRPFFVLLPVAGLLLLEPDFGATVVMLGATAGMLYLGGVGLLRFGLMVLLGVGGIYLLVQDPYRWARITNFSDPWADQFGAGYRLGRAVLAFGRGVWLGVGLGSSVPEQFYLPEAHTDFVFSVLAEELGLVGALLTVALFMFVGLRALYVGLWAERSKQFFSAYVAYGLALLWLGQILINIGVNVGLLPTKGLTLPFLSYGGSSLIICCASLGMLLRIEWESRTCLGSAEVEFSEEDFAVEEHKYAR